MMTRVYHKGVRVMQVTDWDKLQPW